MHPANLDSSGADLSDPFDPDPGHEHDPGQVSSRHPSLCVASNLGSEPLLSGGVLTNNQGPEVTDGSSLMSPTELRLGLADEGHIPLPPLVLSDAVGAMLPAVDQPSVKQNETAVNGDLASDAGSTSRHHHHHARIGGHHHHHRQAGGASHEADAHNFDFVRYKHERDDMFSNSETARDNYEHRTDMSLPDLVGGSDGQPNTHKEVEKKNVVEAPSSLVSHDKSGDASHDQVHHKPCTGGTSVLSNGATTHQGNIPPENAVTTGANQIQMEDTGS